MSRRKSDEADIRGGLSRRLVLRREVLQSTVMEILRTIPESEGRVFDRPYSVLEGEVMTIWQGRATEEQLKQSCTNCGHRGSYHLNIDFQRCMKNRCSCTQFEPAFVEPE